MNGGLYMAKAIRVKRCYHCGAILQVEDKQAPGYIDASTIESNKPDALLYCNKCYNEIKMIGGSQLENSVDDDIITILKDAVATDAFIIWVVDLFSFNGTLNPNIVKQIKGLKLTVVGTKRDLFSSNISDESFARFLKERFKAVGLKPYNVVIFDNNTLNGEEIIKKMNEARQGHDVYMLGDFASGKTSIINRMMKSFKNKSQWTIKTEKYPNTNVQVLEIPLSNSSFFYELPGFALTNSALSRLEKDVAKTLTPKKRVKVTSKLLLEHDALVIGNVMTVEIMKAPDGVVTPMKFYSAEDVEIKKCKNNHINEINAENSRRRFIRPYSEKLISFRDYDLFAYDMEDDGKIHDIAVSGIGWISFVAKGQSILISLPKGVAIKESLGKIR